MGGAYLLSKYLTLQNGLYIGLEVIWALQDLAIFAINRFTILSKLAHVTALNFIKDFLDLMLQAMLNDGPAKDV